MKSIQSVKTWATYSESFSFGATWGKKAERTGEARFSWKNGL